MTDKTKTQGTVIPSWIERYDRVMVVVGVVGPFATLPQLYKLFFSHAQHASGQSLTTWVLYTLTSALWLGYGLAKKDPAIYLGNGISMVMNALMVVGIVLHAGVTF